MATQAESGTPVRSRSAVSGGSSSGGGMRAWLAWAGMWPKGVWVPFMKMGEKHIYKLEGRVAPERQVMGGKKV